MTTRRASSILMFKQRDFNLPGIVLFGRFQHSVSVNALPPHSHLGAIEICFLERGEQTFRVKDRVYRMHGNDQFFTLPSEIHDTANLPEERGILYWLILNLESTGEFLGLAQKTASHLKRELLKLPVRHFLAHSDCAQILAELIDLVSQKQTKPAAYRRLRLQALLLQYLTLTIEASHQGRKAKATPLMQRVLTYIDRHLSDPPYVSKLAEIARLSESRFKARFKREIGVPPAEYWLRQKMERAAQLLKTRNVTEVAHELGFSSSQYFATVFKRYTLTNPSRFHRPKLQRTSEPVVQPPKKTP